MAVFKAVILKSVNDTKGDGTTNIKIRVTHQRKISYIATDLYIDPKHMNNKEGLAKSGKNKSFINLRITDLLQKYRRSDIELGERSDRMSVKDIRAHLLSGETSDQQLDFFKFTSEVILKTKKSNTADQYKYLASSLSSFAGKYLPFSDINLSFLQRYEAFLQNRGVKNGIINYMVTFRALFNKARDVYNDEDINEILIPHYPFRRYKMPKRNIKSNDHVLSIDELKMFKNLKHSTPGQVYAKDMFLLMFYLVGIESKDLFDLKKGHKGRVSYDRHKTGRPYYIKLEPEAIKIIKKYPSNTHLINATDRFKHSKSFYRYINNYLHGEKHHNIEGITQRLGIEKLITTKWAKHTWATIARNECRINKDDVALCLGHEDSDNRVTDMYIKYDHSIVDESNRKVIDFVNLHCASLNVAFDNK